MSAVFVSWKRVTEGRDTRSMSGIEDAQLLSQKSRGLFQNQSIRSLYGIVVQSILCGATSCDVRDRTVGSIAVVTPALLQASTVAVRCVLMDE